MTFRPGDRVKWVGNRGRPYVPPNGLAGYVKDVDTFGLLMVVFDYSHPLLTSRFGGVHNTFHTHPHKFQLEARSPFEADLISYLDTELERVV